MSLARVAVAGPVGLASRSGALFLGTIRTPSMGDDVSLQSSDGFEREATVSLRRDLVGVPLAGFQKLKQRHTPKKSN